MGNTFEHRALPKTIAEYNNLDETAKAELNNTNPELFQDLFLAKYAPKTHKQLYPNAAAATPAPSAAAVPYDVAPKDTPTTFSDLMQCGEAFLAQFREKQPAEYARLYKAEYGHAPKY
ncbi:hypothetical protein [Paludibacter jiangxiensis]|uniref:Uncharacterized protein n=1 Tax=Paludibacter jiangxiensis TaxID=681398 RepID=A0A161LG67_9BACT|nr:hypothetical protein [Paludibacter jiangxiensis]GAT64355.1 hypothetical protein PJIAN_4906 [Paludibacter jiangxiensis]